MLPIRPTAAAATATAAALLLLPKATLSLSVRPAYPSCSELSEPFDCNFHPSTAASYNESTATYGSIGGNVTDDGTCLDECISCLGDVVVKGRFQNKTHVDRFTDEAKEYFQCDCGLDGENFFRELCVDDGFPETSGGEKVVTAAFFSGIQSWAMFTIALAFSGGIL